MKAFHNTIHRLRPTHRLRHTLKNQRNSKSRPRLSWRRDSQKTTADATTLTKSTTHREEKRGRDFLFSQAENTKREKNTTVKLIHFQALSLSLAQSTRFVAPHTPKRIAICFWGGRLCAYAQDHRGSHHLRFQRDGIDSRFVREKTRISRESRVSVCLCCDLEKTMERVL